ncbi:MAG: LptF/LptG family permease [candidate division Zixibacteria bacterium]|nr:LptF/LptG family permease [candidate division Zixibacteria bacterium]MDD5427413.1 LptF/LptG family permease [candidate division Zixibacteria bacterium]
MKKIQLYILKEHVVPFIFAFLIITFLLIIDYVPKIIDHVIDKDLSIWVVLELIGLNLAWMLALSIPMSVLVASLMAFGRLSSDFEIIAIKSSGIHLFQIILPLLLAGSLISFGMVEFNDKVLPDLNKKARLLWGNISAMRPTIMFKSGIFITDIPGYIILIDKIDHATSRVEGVSITDNKDPSRTRLIVAEYGFLKTIDNGRSIQFTLYNGEVHTFDLKDPDNYQKLNFQNQIINISGTGSELVRTDTEYRTDREMPINQLQNNVDRAFEAVASNRNRISTMLESQFSALFTDSLSLKTADKITDSAALAQVRADAQELRRRMDRSLQQIATQQRVVNKYKIEIYKKYSIPMATLAFILIGTPLGILSRKGGMGMAITISILLFIIYWAFLIGGEDLADRGLLSPFVAMWGANILLGCIGLYLIYIVITEKPFFAFFRKIN